MRTQLQTSMWASRHCHELSGSWRIFVCVLCTILLSSSSASSSAASTEDSSCTEGSNPKSIDSEDVRPIWSMPARFARTAVIVSDRGRWPAIAAIVLRTGEPELRPCPTEAEGKCDEAADWFGKSKAALGQALRSLRLVVGNWRTYSPSSTAFHISPSTLLTRGRGFPPPPFSVAVCSNFLEALVGSELGRAHKVVAQGGSPDEMEGVQYVDEDTSKIDFSLLVPGKKHETEPEPEEAPELNIDQVDIRVGIPLFQGMGLPRATAGRVVLVWEDFIYSDCSIAEGMAGGIMMTLDERGNGVTIGLLVGFERDLLAVRPFLRVLCAAVVGFERDLLATAAIDVRSPLLDQAIDKQLDREYGWDLED